MKVKCVFEGPWVSHIDKKTIVPGPTKNEICTVIGSHTSKFNGWVYYRIAGYSPETDLDYFSGLFKPIIEDREEKGMEVLRKILKKDLTPKEQCDINM